ncbi:autophagy protein 13 [Paramarasmius palmivorus]|uniref:Autophagy-related protein 13 n=1 Tax=Paramarasmius palmivorus TaxID=297713 RepID=A0AAW0EGT9_9AGAR
MSNDDTQKADQIALHFYTKLFYVVNDARAIAEPRPQSKVDKWFNLENSRLGSLQQGSQRTLQIPFILTTTSPARNSGPVDYSRLDQYQVLVYNAPDTSRVRVEPVPKTVLLERWTLSFSPTTRGDYDTDESSV